MFARCFFSSTQEEEEGEELPHWDGQTGADWNTAPLASAEEDSDPRHRRRNSVDGFTTHENELFNNTSFISTRSAMHNNALFDGSAEGGSQDGR